jgi:plastocyanin
MRSIGSSLLLLCAAAVHAENHFVTLGYAGDLVFSPDQLAASVGDTLEFQFVAGVSS